MMARALLGRPGPRHQDRGTSRAACAGHLPRLVLCMGQHWMGTCGDRRGWVPGWHRRL